MMFCCRILLFWLFHKHIAIARCADTDTGARKRFKFIRNVGTVVTNEADADIPIWRIHAIYISYMCEKWWCWICVATIFESFAILPQVECEKLKSANKIQFEIWLVLIMQWTILASTTITIEYNPIVLVNEIRCNISFTVNGFNKRPGPFSSPRFVRQNNEPIILFQFRTHFVSAYWIVRCDPA